MKAKTVYVNGFEGGFLELYPLRISKIIKGKSVMLLLIEDDDNNHFVSMRDFSPFDDKLILVSIVFIAFIEKYG